MNEVMHSHDVNRQRPRYPSIGPIDEEVRMIGRHVLPVMPEHLLISHVAGQYLLILVLSVVVVSLDIYHSLNFVNLSFWTRSLRSYLFFVV